MSIATVNAIVRNLVNKRFMGSPFYLYPQFCRFFSESSRDRFAALSAEMLMAGKEREIAAVPQAVW